jgi:hypothetical protein
LILHNEIPPFEKHCWVFTSGAVYSVLLHLFYPPAFAGKGQNFNQLLYFVLYGLFQHPGKGGSVPEPIPATVRLPEDIV